jgi:hypothetical protein
VKTVIVVLVSALFGFPNTGLNTGKKAAPTFRAESSAYIVQAKDTWTYVTENRSFRFAEVLDDRGNYEAPLLLEETYHNERTDGMEGMRGNATVKAWAVKRSGERELRWTLTETGNEGGVHDRFFRITAWGCCDAPTVYSFYSVLTGKKLYVSNSDLVEIWEHGDGPLAARYVAFGYSGMNELSRPPQLQYGTDKKVAQSFSVVSSRKYYDAPRMFVSLGEKVEKSLDLRGSPMNFTIVLKYQDGVELRIPVEADVIRPELAQFPNGYSLRAED